MGSFILRIGPSSLIARSWSLEGAFAEIDVVFEEGFEAAAHLGPAHAVAVGAVEAALGFAPAGFDDADEGVVGFEGFEGYLDRGLVVGLGRFGVEFRGWFIGVPLEDDLLVGDDFFDCDGDVAGVVGEAPDDSRAFVERAGGSAGGEVGAELGWVVDGVEDLGYGPLNFGLDLKFELHGLVPPCGGVAIFICYVFITCQGEIVRVWFLRLLPMTGGERFWIC